MSTDVEVIKTLKEQDTMKKGTGRFESRWNEIVKIENISQLNQKLQQTG